jgi:type VI secretion system protein
MSRGLLARLRAGRASGGSSASVREHLAVLLNTRRGESPAVPDYGIPDFSDVVHSFPLAIPVMQRAIRDTIALYEPRLQKVQVRHVPSDEPLTVTFEISGRIADGGALKLRTCLNAGGKLDLY